MASSSSSDFLQVFFFLLLFFVVVLYFTVRYLQSVFSPEQAVSHMVETMEVTEKKTQTQPSLKRVKSEPPDEIKKPKRAVTQATKQKHDFDTKLTILHCQICHYRTSKPFNMVRHIKAQHIVVEEEDEIVQRSLKSPIVFDNIAIVPLSYLNQTN